MSENIKIVCSNRKAFHDYFIENKIEGGLVLTGPEVKALRDGKCSLVDSFARFMSGELWIVGMVIPPYKNLGYSKHDPNRDKKVLLQKEELKKLHRQILEKGITLIATKVYFKNGWAKAEISLARGKRQYDKRDDIANRTRKREEDRLKKHYKIK